MDMSPITRRDSEQSEGSVDSATPSELHAIVDNLTEEIEQQSRSDSAIELEAERRAEEEHLRDSANASDPQVRIIHHHHHHHHNDRQHSTPRSAQRLEHPALVAQTPPRARFPPASSNRETDGSAPSSPAIPTVEEVEDRRRRLQLVDQEFESIDRRIQNRNNILTTIVGRVDTVQNRIVTLEERIQRYTQERLPGVDQQLELAQQRLRSVDQQLDLAQQHLQSVDQRADNDAPNGRPRAVVSPLRRRPWHPGRNTDSDVDQPDSDASGQIRPVSAYVRAHLESALADRRREREQATERARRRDASETRRYARRDSVSPARSGDQARRESYERARDETVRQVRRLGRRSPPVRSERSVPFRSIPSVPFRSVRSERQIRDPIRDPRPEDQIVRDPRPGSSRPRDARARRRGTTSSIRSEDQSEDRSGDRIPRYRVYRPSRRDTASPARSEERSGEFRDRNSGAQRGSATSPIRHPDTAGSRNAQLQHRTVPQGSVRGPSVFLRSPNRLHTSYHLSGGDSDARASNNSGAASAGPPPLEGGNETAPDAVANPCNAQAPAVPTDQPQAGDQDDQPANSDALAYGVGRSREVIRRLFLSVLIRIVNRGQTNEEAAWQAFVARLMQTGQFRDEIDIRSAWYFAFQEPPGAHFRSLLVGGIRVIRNMFFGAERDDTA